MRIALNLLFLLPGIVGGTETYARELVRSLADIDPDNEYLLFVNRSWGRLDWGSAPNVRKIIAPFDGTRREVRYAWEQLALPLQLRQFGVDVVHSPGYLGPVLAPCPAVLTIHDVNFVALAQLMPMARRVALQLLVRASAQRSQHVITVSDYSCRQLLESMPELAGKISVIYEAAHLSECASVPNSAEIATGYGLEGPYLIAFGSASAHKNLARLIDAFERIASQVPHRLLLIGHTPHELRQRLTDKSRIVAPGYVPDEHVRPLMAGADLLAFPSWYEGFGLPVVEAQALGVPVVCSRSASLPEVAGDGALFFDPFSVDEIAAALLRVLRNVKLQRVLGRKGHENAARFSWQRTAAATLEVYRRAVVR